MPPQAITTSLATNLKLPKAAVYVANALGTSWTLVPYLYCDSLKVAAAPDIDQADLSYTYGPIVREPKDNVTLGNGGVPSPANYETNGLKVYPPLDLLGKYCKVVIPGVANDRSDLTWYGLLEHDDRQPDGSASNSYVPPGTTQVNQVEAGRGEPRGKQKLTAFGLIRLLELTTVLSSVVNQTQTAELLDPRVTIGTGLPFNSYRAGEYHDRGNRSTLPGNFAIIGSPEKAGSGDGTATGLDALQRPDNEYVFSELPQRTRHWNAAQAVAYLLRYNAPQDSGKMPICKWTLTAGPADIDGSQTIGWYDVTVHSDGKNLKTVLDDLISRKRGVGYYVTFSETGGPAESGTGATGSGSTSAAANGVATINVFSFNDTILNYGAGFQSITTQGGAGTQANPNLRSLNFENAFDVECQLVNSIANKYDRVVALGDHKTSTFTLSLDPAKGQIAADWTAAEEALYKTASSGGAGYAALASIPGAQARANTIYRQLDQIRHVYRRFELADSWAHYTWDYDAALGTIYKLIAPLYNADGTTKSQGDYNKTNKLQGEGVWTKGLAILPKLPLKDRFDYTGTAIADKTFDQKTISGESADDIDGEPAHLHPMFFVKTLNSEGKLSWQFLERLSEMSPWANDGSGNGRTWAANVAILNQRPAFEINVAGKPQHFIAKTASAGMAAFDELHDPNLEGGLDFKDMRCTIAVNLFDRVRQEAAVSTDDPVVAGKIERVLYVHVPDARLDYVVPYTIVAIKDGLLQQSTGGFVRDDRPRLASIARSAAEWYGRTRQTIELKLKQVNEVVKLGWLITDVGPNYQLTHVNTPITSCHYDLVGCKTTFRTTHVDVEFE